MREPKYQLGDKVVVDGAVIITPREITSINLETLEYELQYERGKKYSEEDLKLAYINPTSHVRGLEFRFMIINKKTGKSVFNIGPVVVRGNNLINWTYNRQEYDVVVVKLK